MLLRGGNIRLFAFMAVFMAAVAHVRFASPNYFRVQFLTHAVFLQLSKKCSYFFQEKIAFVIKQLNQNTAKNYPSVYAFRLCCKYFRRSLFLTDIPDQNARCGIVNI
jgi:hypothetical protein